MMTPLRAESPEQGDSRENPVRWIVGCLGLTAAVLLLAFFPIFYFEARVWGAAGDRFDRILIGIGLAIVLGFLVALVVLAGWSARTVLRSRWTWACAAVITAVVLWAAFGIDSTRPLRSLPEAELTYPGATEVGRRTAPAEAVGFDAIARATLTRSFVIVDEYADMAAFYTAHLKAAGWAGPLKRGLDHRQLLEWHRDGLMIQLEFPDDSPTGRFSVTIYGPQQ